MQNTLLVALSRQMALSRELDVVANNMANVNTNGFRRQSSEFQEYLMPAASQDGFPQLSDRRISYVNDRGTYRDFSAGAVEQTGNPLDVAISGDAFFTVQNQDSGEEAYTRNGAFQLDAQNRLVTTTGALVMTDNGPFTFDAQQDGAISVAQDGTISTNQGIRGHLKLARFDNPQALTTDGDSLFKAAKGQTADVPATGTARVQQGMIERSNVKSVQEMSRLIEVNRAYTTLSTLIQNADGLRKTAVEQLAALPN